MARIFTSSKFQAAMVQTVLIAIPFVFTLFDKSQSPTAKQAACIAFTVAVASAWGISVHATGQEDAASKSNATQPTAPVDPPPTSPQPAVNVPQPPAAPAQVKPVIIPKRTNP